MEDIYLKLIHCDTNLDELGKLPTTNHANPVFKKFNFENTFTFKNSLHVLGMN